MTPIEIPLDVSQVSVENEIFLSSNNACIYNGFIDGNGRLHKFPGYELLESLGTGKHINGIFGYRDETDARHYQYRYTSAGGATSLSGSLVALKKVSSNDIIWSISNGRYFVSAYEDNALTTIERVQNAPIAIGDRGIYDFEKCNTAAPLKFVRCKGDFSGTFYVEGVDMVFFSDASGKPFYITPWFYTINSDDYPLAYYFFEFVGRISDTEAPSPCSHLTHIDTYLLGNNLTNGIFDISYPGSPLQWDGDFATAGYRADNIAALIECKHKLICFGAESAEVWINNTTGPFAPEYNHINSGTVTPYSVQNCDGILYWLDNENRPVACDIGESLLAHEISPTLTKRIYRDFYTEDCIGNFLKTGHDRFYLIDFTTAETTYAINVKTGTWSQLGKWDSKSNRYKAFPLLHCTYTPNIGAIAAGKTNDVFYRVSPRYHTFNGDEIRTMVRTPTINHGNNDEKTIGRIEIMCERTMDKSISDITIEPKIMIRWRDNGGTGWNPWRRISLDNPGRTSHFIEIYNCGQYISRQYEIVMLGDYPMCISSIKEIHE